MGQRDTEVTLVELPPSGRLPEKSGRVVPPSQLILNDGNIRGIFSTVIIKFQHISFKPYPNPNTIFWYYLPLLKQGKQQ